MKLDTSANFLIKTPPRFRAKIQIISDLVAVRFRALSKKKKPLRPQTQRISRRAEPMLPPAALEKLATNPRGAEAHLGKGQKRAKR